MSVDPHEDELDNLEEEDNDDDYIDTVETSGQWTDWRDAFAQHIYQEWKERRGHGMEKPTNSRKKGGKAREGGNAEENVVDAVRRSWNQREEDALLNAMKEMVVKGERIENSFKSGYLGKVDGMLLVALPGTSIRANPHISSKLKVWEKKNYYSIKAMRGCSGLRWNDSTHMIKVMDDKIWEDFCKTDNNASGPSATDTEVNLDEASKETGGDSSTVNTIDNSPEEHSKKKAKVSENILARMNNFANKLGIYFKRSDAKIEMLGGRMGYAHDLSKKRAEVNDALRKLPITVESRVLAGMAITQDAQKVDHFFSLDDEKKMIMVKKLCNLCP
ncbi:hypothetical protein RHSIM_Rhsim13G0113900 [Rhododendron simsii]|uniref:Myb/SANT-like domain-containing protein n=1 Tax=Rhododendron simsii TaxID=118357 RepID=A0A834L3Z6_RHOSS|nr:hypothetical protein RHSIM_Rhsim13G0113900 [Rhododendron simsii]